MINIFRLDVRLKKEVYFGYLSTKKRTDSTKNATIQDTYVPEENASGSNVYLNGSSTVTELPTPSRGMVNVKVSSNVHPESETNLRCLDKIEVSNLCPTGKLVAV